MNHLICYKTMPEWDFHSLPQGFRKQHNTQVGTWAKLTILSGKLQYDALDKTGNVLETVIFDKDSDIPFVAPQAWHKVAPLTDDLRCQLAFYCEPQDYYQKKYQLSAVHSEVSALMTTINLDNKSAKVLDVGCGGGRNALFLNQQGFDVTAFDKNPSAIEKLQEIISSEQLDKLTAFAADASQVALQEKYDLIISTVVLMFLDAKQVPGVISTMQTHTKIGGYNLIVCALDSEDYPLAAHTLPFSFGFKSGELRAYYQDWNIVKYNEDVGHLHRKDANGNPIALRFATLLTQKK